MHPSRGGSLMKYTTPAKGLARIKQVTPAIINKGSCAVSTIDPASQEGLCESTAVSRRIASQIGFKNLPRQLFHGCASSTIYRIKIVTKFGMQCLKSTVKTFREKEKRADIFIEYNLQKKYDTITKAQPHPAI